MPLIDHHVHGCWLTAGDRRRFENGAQRGQHRATRRLRLGVRHPARLRRPRPLRAAARPAAPRRRRHATGTAAASSASPSWRDCSCRPPGVSDWLVDTGFADGVADLDRMADVSGGRAHEVVRLEQVAEQAAAARRATTRPPSSEILHARGADRGRARSRSWPTAADSTATCPSRRAAEVATPPPGGATAAAPGSPIGCCCASACIEALRLGKPLQFHVGFGDRDCDLHDAIRCTCWTFCAVAATRRSCCCTAIRTSGRPATWPRRSTTSTSTAG